MTYSHEDILEAIAETDALMQIYKEVHEDAPEERYSAMRMRVAVEAIKAYLDQREVHFENLSNMRAMQ